MSSINREAVRQALVARGLSEEKIEEILGCLPKPKVVKIRQPPVQLTAEEQRVRAEQQADDARSDEYKRRLVPSYHKKQNTAGRHNPMMRLAEIKHIQECCQGLRRFEAPRVASA